MAKLEIVRKRTLNGDFEAVVAGIEIHDSGLIVQGSAYIPRHAVELVNIFCPGVGVNHFQARHYTQRIFPRNMGTITLTIPGHIPTGGEYNPNKNVDYINLVIDHVPQIFLTDQVLLSGHSGGGRDAMGTAAVRDYLKGLMLINPAYNIYEAMTREWAYFISSMVPSLTGPIVKKMVNKGWKLEEIDHWSKFRIEDFSLLVQTIKDVPSAGDYADKLSCPVIIFHGTSDERVPFCESEKLMKELEDRLVDVEFVRLKSASHNPFFEEDALKVIRGRLTKWLKSVQKSEKKPKGISEALKERKNELIHKWFVNGLKERYF